MEYRFNQFRLDPERNLFYQDNKLVEIESRIFQLLDLLLQRYPETITRRELLDTLWANQEISDGTLSQLIHRARLLLGDDGRAPTYIKTIHGVGVRFLLEPDVAVAAASDTTRIRHNKSLFRYWWAVIPMILLVWLGTRYLQPVDDTLAELGSYPYTIAVLPFENSSGNEANAWIRLGLMDMVGQLLSEPVGIKTISTKNMLAYLNNKPVTEVFSKPQNMQQAFDTLCKALGCQILVAARLDKSVSEGRLSYQIATQKGVHPLKVAQGNTVMDAGSNLVQEITKLIDPAQPWVINARATYSADDAANRAYALGAQELFDGDAQAAAQYLEIALQKEPGFHWAKVKLADAEYRLNKLDRSDVLIQELLNAESLPDDIRYQALHVRSNIRYAQGKLSESREASEMLFELAKKSADLILQGAELMNIGSSYLATGDTEQALNYLQQAEQQYKKAHYKPGIGSVLFNMGNVHTTVNKFSLAIFYYEDAELIFQQLGNQQHVAMARFQQANVFKSIGQLGKAKKKFSDLLPLFEKLDDKEGAALVVIESAYIEHLEGHSDLTIQKLLALLPQLQSEQLQYAAHEARIRLAQVYLSLHQPEAAKAYIEQNSEFDTPDPDTALLSAHLAYEEHRFTDALALAQMVKKAADSAWLPKHEVLLQAYQVAVSSGEWQKIAF